MHLANRPTDQLTNRSTRPQPTDQLTNRPTRPVIDAFVAPKLLCLFKEVSLEMHGERKILIKNTTNSDNFELSLLNARVALQYFKLETNVRTRWVWRVTQLRVSGQGPLLRSTDHFGRSSEARNSKTPKKKVKCDGRTDGPTDQRTFKAGCRVA